jgi:hypothetical protein
LQERDNYKRIGCKNEGYCFHLFLNNYKLLGITLIEVPFWWNKKIESLEEMIYNQRPELLNNRLKISI